MSLINHLRTKIIWWRVVIYSRYLIGSVFIYAFCWKAAWDTASLPDTAGTTNSNPVMGVFRSIMQIKYLWYASLFFQLASGILMVTQRYSLLGALIYLPVILSISLITWSSGFIGTKFITLVLTLGVVALITWDYKKLLPLLGYEYGKQEEIQPLPEKDKWWILIGVIICFVSLLRLFDTSFIFWIASCLLVGISGLIGYRKRKYFKLG